jgi:hypothetical protein
MVCIYVWFYCTLADHTPVNARNVCSLLTAVAPSSVAEFKDAALEYVCLSLEAVMQNGSLDELDEDLLLELNEVAHENQLAYLPFARSGRAEALLFDRYPELAERIERGKRAKVDAIVLSNKYADNDNLSYSFRAQSLEEVAASPLRQRNRRRVSKEAKSPVSSPALKGKASTHDLMFEMSDGEEDDGAPKKIKPLRFTEQSGDEKAVETPVGSPDTPWGTIPRPSPHTFEKGGDTPFKSVSPLPPPAVKETRLPGQPWGTTPLAGPKLDLKDIMAQDSSATPSNLSLGLSRGESERVAKAASAKLSQKERKRQAQQLGAPIAKPEPVPPAVSPWTAAAHRKPSNSPVVVPVVEPSPPPNPSPQPSRASSTPQLTMRQTVAKKGAASKQKDKRTASQSQDANGAGSPSQPRPTASERGMSVSTDPIPTPRSVRHIPLPQHSLTSPSQHLSMMEILSLQEAEKTSIRDAAAKRSLQEIQQEQEFQQWWDQESRRVIEEEEQTKKLVDKLSKGAARGRGKGRGSRGGKAKSQDKKDGGEEAVRGKGNRDVSAGPAAKDSAPPKPAPKQDTSGRAPGRDNATRGGRGKIGRGGRGGARGGRAQGPSRDGTAASAQQVQTPVPQT